MDNQQTIDRLEDFVERLERVVYGDDYARVPGLLNQVEGLRSDMQSVRSEVQAVRTDIQAVRSRRANLWLWGLGYVTFLVSGLFAMSAFQNMPEVRALLDMPAPVAAVMAAVFALAAVMLFAGGFGWLSRGP